LRDLSVEVEDHRVEARYLSLVVYDYIGSAGDRFLDAEILLERVEGEPERTHGKDEKDMHEGSVSPST